jgi:hypothetical protein
MAWSPYQFSSQSVICFKSSNVDTGKHTEKPCWYHRLKCIYHYRRKYFKNVTFQLPKSHLWENIQIYYEIQCIFMPIYTVATAVQEVCKCSGRVFGCALYLHFQYFSNFLSQYVYLYLSIIPPLNFSSLIRGRVSEYIRISHKWTQNM